MKKFLGILGFVLTVLRMAFLFGYCGWTLNDIVDTKENTVFQQNKQISINALNQDTTSNMVVGNGSKGLVVNLPSKDDVLSKFTEEYWINISIAEIEAISEELGLLMSYDLALEDFVEVDIIYDSTVNWIGCSYRYKDLIEINLYQLYKHCSTYKEEAYVYIVNVLAHEHRHAYQKQRVAQGFKTKLEYSYQHYIPSTENYRAYYNQLCERDARNYGAYWENLLELWLIA